MSENLSGSLDKPQLLRLSQGRWLDIFAAAGIPAHLLDHGGKPCPKCGGTDRLNADRDVASNGKVFCRGCFNKSSAIRPGDGFATVAWWQGSTYGQATKWVADYLGVTNTPPPPIDIIQATADNKRMPVEAFRQFGVVEAKRGRKNIRVARIDVYNEMGEVHSYFDLWPGSKGYSKPGKGSSGMFFPGRLPTAGEIWLLVEGVKDAAALVGMGYQAAGLPTNNMNAKYARLFPGVHVIFVPDLDNAGLRGAQLSASRLAGIASSVRIARLPGELRPSGGADVRDALKIPDGEKLVREAMDQAKPWQPGEDDEPSDQRPDVVVTMEEAEVSQEVIEHLAKLGWTGANAIDEKIRLFVRGGVLVQVIEQDKVGDCQSLVIRDIPSCMVRERITQACRLVTETETEEGVEVKPVRPPGWLIDGIFRRGSYDRQIKPLAGIIEAPTLRVDGSIIQAPGYDAETGLVYRPSAKYPTVIESPTQQEAHDAVTTLLEVLVDFPMQDEADRSAWLALVLTMVGRPCIAGNVPLFAVTANIRGAGKSLLVDAATLIAYGHRAARKTFTRDDDEMRKVITAVALAAIPSVLFDNVDIQMGGASLDAAITSTVWSDRVLGQSRMTGDLPMQVVWSATGNNLAFGSDIGRRVLPIRLNSLLETPETRNGFQHPNLLEWIERNRPRLAVAALTILRAYFLAGTPQQNGGQWGSFESWSEIARGALVWAGAADPLPTRETALASDDTVILLSKLILGIAETDPTGIGLTTKEIEQATFGNDAHTPRSEVLLEAVTEICGDGFNNRKFGRRVRNLSKRVWKGQFIDSTLDRTGVQRWRVRQANAGFAGFEGSSGSESRFPPRSSNPSPSADDASLDSQRFHPHPANHANPAPSDGDWGEV
ncbi:hypothetical protein [Bremerella cremea]|uniref:hypothetical protein n=1 Tax=Bremerella cremea TaxID=1031537 RepID=UPI0031EBF598